ncbi:MAG: hypothetical protein ACI8RZ_006800 [Myxococcota bacterium]
MSRPLKGTVAVSPSLPVGDGRSIRLLALEVGAGGDETYHVSLQTASNTGFRPGVMRHTRGLSWDIFEGGSRRCTTVELGSPDAVFSLALGHDSQGELAMEVAQAAPYWPASLTARLARRRLSGAGTIAFDARWFVTQLTASAMDHPLLLVDAASKLGLTSIGQAAAVLGAVRDRALPDVLVDALGAARTLHWSGDGRLIGEFVSGELAQLGTDIDNGCRAALRSGLLQVVFEPSEPLGLSLGPLRPGDFGADSVGAGAVVGEVEPHGAADRAGVLVGMVLSRLSEPDCLLSQPFEAVLDEIDARRADGLPLAITFDTAVPITHLYAVEMPAAAVLSALAAAQDRPTSQPLDVGASLNTLCGHALLWKEDTPRLFIGEAGSVTCAHTDICPQLQLAHGLLGTKLLGVASHAATAHLGDEHGDDEGDSDEEATFISTDRPLTTRQSRLLTDVDVTLLVLQDGDLAVFDSGALHFASNGAQGLSGSLYYGIMTPAALPRLRLSAAQSAGAHSSSDGAYGDHLFASDLLRLVERRMRVLEKTGELLRP